MVPGILTFLVIAALAAFSFGATALAGDRTREDTVFARDEDAGGVIAIDDGDDVGDTNGDTNGDTGGTGNTGNSDTGGATSGIDSGDGTDSRHTSVSMNRDRSRGDLTRDRTKDGPGTSTRDRSSNQTNDGTRNDTR